MSQSESHPLFFHAIVLFLIAAVVLTFGIIGIVHAAGDVKVNNPGGLKGTQQAISDAQRAQSDAQRLASAPTGMSDAASKLNAAAGLKQMSGKVEGVGALLMPILTIVFALGIGASGLFVLWKANWARFVAFGLTTATVFGFVWGQSAANGNPEFEFAVWKPIILVVVAFLAGKFLWDLFVEKFEEVPAAA